MSHSFVAVVPFLAHPKAGGRVDVASAAQKLAEAEKLLGDFCALGDHGDADAGAGDLRRICAKWVADLATILFPVGSTSVTGEMAVLAQRASLWRCLSLVIKGEPDLLGDATLAALASGAIAMLALEDVEHVNVECVAEVLQNALATDAAPLRSLSVVQSCEILHQLWATIPKSRWAALGLRRPVENVAKHLAAQLEETPPSKRVFTTLCQKLLRVLSDLQSLADVEGGSKGSGHALAQRITYAAFFQSDLIDGYDSCVLLSDEQKQSSANGDRRKGSRKRKRADIGGAKAAAKLPFQSAFFREMDGLIKARGQAEASPVNTASVERTVMLIFEAYLKSLEEKRDRSVADLDEARVGEQKSQSASDVGRARMEKATRQRFRCYRVFRESALRMGSALSLRVIEPLRSGVIDEHDPASYPSEDLAAEGDCVHALLRIVASIHARGIYQPSEDASLGQEKALRRGIGEALRLLAGPEFRKRFRRQPSNGAAEPVLSKMLWQTASFIRVCLQVQHRLFESSAEPDATDADTSRLWVQSFAFCEQQFAYFGNAGGGEVSNGNSGLLDSIFDTFLQLRNVSQLLRELSVFLSARDGERLSATELFGKDGPGYDRLSSSVAKLPIAETQAVVSTLCTLAKESLSSTPGLLGELSRVVSLSLPLSADNANSIAKLLCEAFASLESALEGDGRSSGALDLCVWLYTLHKRCTFFYECVHPDYREAKIRPLLLELFAKHSGDPESHGGHEALTVFGLEVVDDIHVDVESLFEEDAQGTREARLREIRSILDCIFEGMRSRSGVAALQAWRQIIEHILTLQNYLPVAEQTLICDFLARSALGDEGEQARRYALSILEDAAVYEVSFLGEGLAKAFAREVVQWKCAATSGTGASGKPEAKKSRRKSPKKRSSVKDEKTSSAEVLRQLHGLLLNEEQPHKHALVHLEDHLTRRIAGDPDRSFWNQRGIPVDETSTLRIALAVGIASALPADCYPQRAFLVTLMYVFLTYLVETTHAARGLQGKSENGTGGSEPAHVLLEQLCVGSHQLLHTFLSCFSTEEEMDDEGRDVKEKLLELFVRASEHGLAALSSEGDAEEEASRLDSLRAPLERLCSFAVAELARCLLSSGQGLRQERDLPEKLLRDGTLLRRGFLMLVSNSGSDKSDIESNRIVNAMCRLLETDSNGAYKARILDAETRHQLLVLACATWWNGKLPECLGNKKSAAPKLKTWFMALPEALAEQLSDAPSGSLDRSDKVKYVSSLYDLAWVVVTAWKKLRGWLGMHEDDMRAIDLVGEDTPHVKPADRVLQVHGCTGCIFILMLEFYIEHEMNDERKDFGLLLTTFAANLSDEEFVGLARQVLSSSQGGALPRPLQTRKGALTLPASRLLLCYLVLGAKSPFQVAVCRRAAPSVALALNDGLDEALQLFTVSWTGLDQSLNAVNGVNDVWDCFRFLIMKRDRWFMTLGQLHLLLAGSAQVLSAVLERVTKAVGKTRVVQRGAASVNVASLLGCLGALKSGVHSCTSMTLALLLANPALAARAPVPLFSLLRVMQRALAIPPVVAVEVTSGNGPTLESKPDGEGQGKQDGTSQSEGGADFLSTSPHDFHIKTCRLFARLLEAISGPKLDGKFRRFMPVLISDYAKHAAVQAPALPKELQLQEMEEARLRWVAGATHTPGLGADIRGAMEQGIHWMIAVLSKHERIHVIQSLQGVELAMVKRMFRDFEVKSKYRGAK